MNAIEWYNYIAKRNGGYTYSIIPEQMGTSAEDVFEEELLEVISNKVVLDAGCGHGEFTLKMAEYAKKIVGIDFAEELIKIANRLKGENNNENTEFITINSNNVLPFKDGYFNVIYSRRGPTNIYKQGNLLKSGGMIKGIHNYPIEHRNMETELRDSGLYSDISSRIYQDAIFYFKNAEDYAEYLSSSNMSVDYTLDENKEQFDEILKNSYINGRIGIKESKHIWQAVKI